MNADQASAQLKTKMGLMIFTATAFVVFVLVVVGTPVEFYTNSNSKVTLWEVKPNHGSNIKIGDLGLCDDDLSRFRAMEAFAIISIFFALVTLLLGVVGMAGVFENKFASAGLAAATMASTIIVWTIAADLFLNDHCGMKLKDGNSYGAGFGLFVTAWCLTIVEAVAVLVL